MGNLVFQATLGGQVNLVGPNTASTYNLNVPTVNATLATTDANTFTAAQTISSGNLIFSGTGQKVSADYSNATLTSRAAFQSSTSNGSTGIYALPNGTSTAASWQATNAADPTNASKVLIATNGSTDVQLVSGRNGTGTYLPLTFYTNGSEQMRLDTSGNLGLGVTPSAWNSAWKFLQFPAGVAFGTDGGNLHASQNVYSNSGGTDTYIATGTATRYKQGSGAHYWYNAPSGTAGTAITFTQAMTLDASGRLGVARTSPGAQLDVLGAASVSAMRIVGNSGASIYVDLSGGGDNYYDATNNIFRNASGTERARIDSSGRLLVGTTSYADGNISVVTSGSNWGIGIKDVGANTAMIKFVNSAGSQAGSITISGTTTNYGSGSDYRLKEEVQPMNDALAKVASLRPVTWKWKADGSNGQGFIAHELQEIIPEAVFGEKDAVEEDGSIKAQMVDASFLVATLTAAIQEQQAIITQLQADVANVRSELTALKGNA
jgi:hypothetical protein